MKLKGLFLVLLLLATACKKEEAEIVCEGSFKGKDQAGTKHCVQGEWDITFAEGGSLSGPTALTNTYINITATDSIYYWKKGQPTAADKIVWKTETNFISETFNVMTFSGTPGTDYSWVIDGIYSSKLKVIDNTQGFIYTMERKD